MSVPSANGGVTAPARVVVSNGFNRFQLTIAAAEAARHGSLERLITGVYPTRAVTTTARVMPQTAPVERLLKRAESVPAGLVESIWLPELTQRAGRVARARRRSVSEAITELTMRWYGARAARIVRRADAQIYHYRSGFGGRSAVEARRRGLRTICDHSIAHPGTLEYLVANDGRLPDATIPPRSRVWQHVLRDVELADLVLVNSDFVKDTFVNQGYDGERVKVIYWGIDEQFVDALPDTRRHAEDGPLRLCFAGSLEDRKGARVLQEGLLALDDVPWTLRVAGSAAEASAETSLLREPRVTALGTLSRSDLARELASAEVFVFPSFAEGSARVVFEALAAGCYVITTPNSGSVVEDGIHGRVVPPGDRGALGDAIREIYARRGDLPSIAVRNREFVLQRYSQHAYGDELMRLYAELAA